MRKAFSSNPSCSSEKPVLSQRLFVTLIEDKKTLFNQSSSMNRNGKNKRVLTINPRWFYSIVFWPLMSFWTQVVRLLAVYALTVVLVLYACEGFTFAQRRCRLIALYGKSIQVDWFQVRMCSVHPMLLWQVVVSPWHTFPNTDFKGPPCSISDRNYLWNFFEFPQLNCDHLTSNQTLFSVLIIALENELAQPTY